MGEHWSASAVRQVKGSIKEAVGKITGNAKLEAEGASEKTAGTAQNPAADAENAAPETCAERGMDAAKPMRSVPAASDDCLQWQAAGQWAVEGLK